MNVNLAHNIINIAIVAATAALVSSGCVSSVAGALDCSNSWIDPQITVPAIGILGAAKIGLNLWRDGLGGLWKRQPPVEK